MLLYAIKIREEWHTEMEGAIVFILIFNTVMYNYRCVALEVVSTVYALISPMQNPKKGPPEPLVSPNNPYCAFCVLRRAVSCN